MSADARIAAAREWLGVPFRAHGYDQKGVDCVWLTLAILRDAHDARIKVPAEYRLNDSGLLQQMVGRYLRWRRYPKVGDFFLVRPAFNAPPAHIALYVGNTLIHCSPKRGVVEDLFTPAWRRLTHSGWSVP